MVIQTSKPVCVELYKDYKDLGRFMLRYGGETIAAGVVTEVSSSNFAHLSLLTRACVVYNLLQTSLDRNDHQSSGLPDDSYDYLTIIPRAHVGYEMIDSQRGA